MERLIQVEGGVNMRDLGGYPTADGRVTQFGRLIRSANLDRLTPAGQQALLDYGLRSIIDLRSLEETRHYPDVFAGDGRVRYLHLPFASDDYSPAPTHLDLHEFYCESLQPRRENIRTIVATISDSEPGILFHCAIGKDRTGMISALLLGLAGVSADTIAEDYAESARHLAPFIAEWREHAVRNGHDMRIFERDVAATVGTMKTTLEFLDSEYGGARAYLDSCGVTDVQLARLKSLLLD